MYTRCKTNRNRRIRAYDLPVRVLLVRLKTGLLAMMFTRKQRWRRVRVAKSIGLQAADYAAMLGAHYDPRFVSLSTPPPRRRRTAETILPAQQRASSSSSLSLPSSPINSNNDGNNDVDFLLPSPSSSGCITYIKPAAASRGSSVRGAKSNDRDRNASTVNHKSSTTISDDSHNNNNDGNDDNNGNDSCNDHHSNHTNVIGCAPGSGAAATTPDTTLASRPRAWSLDAWSTPGLALIRFFSGLGAGEGRERLRANTEGGGRGGGRDAAHGCATSSGAGRGSKGSVTFSQKIRVVLVPSRGEMSPFRSDVWWEEKDYFYFRYVRAVWCVTVQTPGEGNGTYCTLLLS